LDSNGNPILDLNVNADGRLINPNGVNPDQRLLFGDDGFLYGATEAGGVNGTGVIYRVPVSGGSVQVLKTFDVSPPIITDSTDPNFGKTRTNTTGAYPTGPLLNINGTLYGTTTTLGVNGVGTAFSMVPDGSGFNAFHAFIAAECSTPSGQLILDTSGMLIGTCQLGGTVPPDRIITGVTTPTPAGNIFQLSLDGTTFNQLYAFAAEEQATKGANPGLGVVRLTDGNLYGVAGGGVNGSGMIFKYGDAVVTTGNVQGTPPPIKNGGALEWSLIATLALMGRIRKSLGVSR
jgi:uncharacterized repeat protein (TIGR03803 family)